MSLIVQTTLNDNVSSKNCRQYVQFISFFYLNVIFFIISDGKGCTVYDIVINPKFFKKIQKSELFCTFMVSMSIEGLEEKYGLKFNRGMKNC